MKMHEALQYLIDTGSPDALSRLLRLKINSRIEALLNILPSHFKTLVASCCGKYFVLNQDFLGLELDACVSFKEGDTAVDIKSASDTPLVPPANTPNVATATVSLDRQETLLGFVCRQLSVNDRLSKQDKDNLISLINDLLKSKAKADIPNSYGTYPIKYLIECDYIPSGLRHGVFRAFSRMLKELNLETVRMNGHSILDMIWNRENGPFFRLGAGGEDDSLEDLEPVELSGGKERPQYDARFLFLFILIQHIAKKYPSALSEKSKKLEKLTAHEYNEAQWTTIVTIHNIFASRHEGDNVNSLVINIQSAAVTCSDTLNQYYKGIIDKLEQENRTLKAESTDIVRPLLMHPASTALAATSSTSTITLSSISINIAPSAPSLSEMGNKKAEPANATAASSTTAAHPLSQHK